MDTALCNLGRGTARTNPADSCSDVTNTCPSGFYWVRSSNGTAVQVYWDVQRLFSYNTGPWTCVAYLNMTDPSQQCPSTWTLQTRSSEPRRLCGRTSSGGSCDSVTYSTFGVNYSRVCGRVIGYQSRVPDAFANPSQTIEGYYVDGISLTHGPPGSRQHIWTFAAAWDRGKQSIHLSNPLLSMCWPCYRTIPCSLLCGKWLLLWECKSCLSSCLHILRKWSILGWSGLWSGHLLWAELPTRGDPSLVL